MVGALTGVCTVLLAGFEPSLGVGFAAFVLPTLGMTLLLFVKLETALAGFALFFAAMLFALNVYPSLILVNQNYCYSLLPISCYNLILHLVFTKKLAGSVSSSRDSSRT